MSVQTSECGGLSELSGTQLVSEDFLSVTQTLNVTRPSSKELLDQTYCITVTIRGEIELIKTLNYLEAAGLLNIKETEFYVYGFSMVSGTSFSKILKGYLITCGLTEKKCGFSVFQM